MGKLKTTFKERGVTVIPVPDRQAALKQLQELIPAGATVVNGGSVTLEEIGFTDYFMEQENPWRNLKQEWLAEDDADKRLALRRDATKADYFLGGVNAIAETGQLVWGSNLGSQLAPYAYNCPHPIWVAGKNKIVPDLPAAIDRLYQVVLPRYSKQWEMPIDKSLGKVLIFEQEFVPGKQNTLILVDEELGW